MAITQQYLHDGVGPDHGGDRPRVTVLVRYESLVEGLTGATLVGADEPISPTAARSSPVTPTCCRWCWVVDGGRSSTWDGPAGCSPPTCAKR